MFLLNAESRNWPHGNQQIIISDLDLFPYVNRLYDFSGTTSTNGKNETQFYSQINQESNPIELN